MNNNTKSLTTYRQSKASEPLLQHMYNLITMAEQGVETPIGHLDLTNGDIETLMIDFISAQDNKASQAQQTAQQQILVERGVSIELQRIPSVKAKLAAKLLWQDKLPS